MQFYKSILKLCNHHRIALKTITKIGFFEKCLHGVYRNKYYIGILNARLVLKSLPMRTIPKISLDTSILTCIYFKYLHRMHDANVYYGQNRRKGCKTLYKVRAKMDCRLETNVKLKYPVYSLDFRESLHTNELWFYSQTTIDFLFLCNDYIIRNKSYGIFGF